MTELNSCDRNCMTCKDLNIYYLPFIKSFLAPGLLQLWLETVRSRERKGLPESTQRLCVQARCPTLLLLAYWDVGILRAGGRKPHLFFSLPQQTLYRERKC